MDFLDQIGDSLIGVITRNISIKHRRKRGIIMLRFRRQLMITLIDFLLINNKDKTVETTNTLLSLIHSMDLNIILLFHNNLILKPSSNAISVMNSLPPMVVSLHLSTLLKSNQKKPHLYSNMKKQKEYAKRQVKSCSTRAKSSNVDRS